MAFDSPDVQNYARGLEGVIAAISAISAIDGQEGKLVYRGIDIESLAEHSTFEETTYLLMFGDLPTRDELANFTMDLKEKRDVPHEIIDILEKLPHDAHPMDILKTAISALGTFDPDKDSDTRGSRIRKAIRIIAQVPTIVAYTHRISEGLEIIPPSKKFSHAKNFLYMVSGEEPNERDAKIFDIALILHADHGLNASTFSSLVTISTLSDIYSAITSAVGTLKGPLHGGANERVLDMLAEIGTPDNVENYIKEAVEKKKKIMGFGHRVYRAYDPRARILRKYAEMLATERNERSCCEMANRIEAVMKELFEEKGIFPNVDFYSGVVYRWFGIPKRLFTPVFAIGRVSGWVSHVLEYLQANRIFRPRAIYNGPIDVEYIPIEERS